MVVTDILGDGPPIPANFIRLAQPPKKLQNVMAITDFLALFWQFQHN